MRLVNRSGRSRGIPGNPAIVLHPGESAQISAEDAQRLQANATTKEWLDKGLVAILEDEASKPVNKRVRKAKRS